LGLQFTPSGEVLLAAHPITESDSVIKNNKKIRFISQPFISSHTDFDTAEEQCKPRNEKPTVFPQWV
jgi:hypothetical protein